jgi:hypothetical protein
VERGTGKSVRAVSAVALLGGVKAAAWRPTIRSAARSATASTVACSGAFGMTGMTEASATRSPSIP